MDAGTQQQPSISSRQYDDEGNGEEDEHRFALEPLIRERGVDEFVELMKLKRKGWEAESLDHHFQQQRIVADNSGEKETRIWFIRMRGVLSEINDASRCIPAKREMSFLDVGCCPGGFTSYIMSTNRRATGVGISLEVESGGHESIISPKLMKKFHIIYADLTYFRFTSTHYEDERLRDIPNCIREQRYDLILLDAHHLRKQAKNVGWNYHRLQIAQLIIALMAIGDNGTIVMKLSNPHRDFPAQMLYMLDVLSLNLILCKPTSMHGNRGTFYAIAKGFGLGSQCTRSDVFLKGLQELWVQLTFGGEEGKGRYMKRGDLDFVVTMECLAEHYVDRLVDLCRGVWAVQAEALRNMFRRKGISV
ncbi:hypothetical protein SERLA73DRAFT_90613 [Serpula lacrymans var. lacrymans S7.3]|uniref:Ribosomal RNA methyltransferase FtsJ domain-containing protein n=2 Tax=Serpula lacrymans var. lacrymans TaxID=341189 RepID=F8PWW2_SERL3|nr:uncharacterized protein SERLADRAFT_468768 [Serpula lacrymans var. lacrymans S7.9]EGN99289.1 hypothetical protein SERLA73DRAFT_90613 [Serpula lacrymans var. lacrymans S7.3]EGO24855.1 hypothetical protein SERLADRAFT_468768 [Serpula lacrymans var. lacrymans S7.9]